MTDYDKRAAYELGFYRARAEILQDYLRSALRMVPFDCPEFEKRAHADLEADCLAMIEKMEAMENEQ